jgi:putative aldouronate transport system permease protein
MPDKQRKPISWFTVFNACFLILAGLICLIPMIHIAAVSFSSSAAAATGKVTLWPLDFSLNSYDYVAKRAAFWRSMGVSVQRIVLGGSINLLLVILTAYPLSKERSEFGARTFFAWAFFITMLFGGGLIPWYMVIRQFKLIDTIWALVLPGAVPVFSMILMLNFFRQVPKDLAEAAEIDGAGHWMTLFGIYVPVSTPALATILLFSLVGHWNSWFDGLILMNKPDNYPLQSYIQTIVVQRTYSQLTREEIEQLATISDKTLRSAQIFIGSIPIVLVYPFLQKYFVKGIVLGGVKG